MWTHLVYGIAEDLDGENPAREVIRFQDFDSCEAALSSAVSIIQNQKNGHTDGSALLLDIHELLL